MDIFAAQKLIGDDIIETMFERYKIVEYIKSHQPAGRRRIAENLNIPERQIRNHLNYLIQKKILDFDNRGVILNGEAEDITPFLDDFFSKIYSSYERETTLAQMLGIKNVIIAKGDCDADPSAVNNLGFAAENYFIDNLEKRGGVIAVSGGASLKAFTDNLISVPRPNYIVVPVRGAIGVSHSYQANTIALHTSLKLKCNAYQLNIPDTMDSALIKSLVNHPDIKTVTACYERADILLFGIGRSDSLSKFRNLNQSEIEFLEENGCDAEVVGYYLNSFGEVIKKSTGIGMKLSDLRRIPTKIAIGGGSSKVRAVKALCSFMQDITLITDEGCASALLNNKLF